MKMGPIYKFGDKSFKHGDIVNILREDCDNDSVQTYTNCKIIYVKELYGAEEMRHFILSNNSDLDGSNPRREDMQGYRYAWALSNETEDEEEYIVDIELVMRAPGGPSIGKWANGSFRNKLKEKNLI